MSAQHTPERGVEIYSEDDGKLLCRLAVVICDDGAMYGNGTLRTARRIIDFLNADERYALLTRMHTKDDFQFQDANGDWWGRYPSFPISGEVV